MTCCSWQPHDDETGSAVLMALMLAALVSALGLGLLTLSTTERALVGNFGAGVQRAYDGDALAELVTLELGAQAAWTDVLTGGVRSFLRDETINMTADVSLLTRRLQRETDLASLWGLNTPVWRLFASGSLDQLYGSQWGRAGYVVAWVADDGSETDNDPAVDANGRILVHVEAHDARGAAQAIDLVLQQREPGTPPGRILSWKSTQES